MNLRNEIKNYLDSNAKFRDKLFNYGFLLTNNTKIDSEIYPFYGLWKKERISNFVLLVSPNQTYFIRKVDCGCYVLIGHCVDPLDLLKNENDIIDNLQKSFYSTFNQLTGVFTLIYFKDNTCRLYGDPSTIQSVYYGQVDNFVYFTTHENLVGDILDLSRNSYISNLIGYKFFKFFGSSLPGDLSQFSELKRLVPNHFIHYDSNHFWIDRFYTPHNNGMSENEIVDFVSYVLSNTLRLLSEKYDRPAVSLSGGVDSKTTLSCINGFYKQFFYYSFVSSNEERIDAVAASSVCNAIGINHKTYEILESFEPKDKMVYKIINWNNGGLLPINDNDLRKHVYFLDVDDFDIEIKSWVSEIGRAYFSKRFNNRKKFGMITPRKCTTLYKVFLNNRCLVKKTDAIFKQYIDLFFLDNNANTKNIIPWQEQFFWEFRVSSWNGRVITGEQRFSHDITIPYNNRLVIEALLSATLEDRIYDRIYSQIRLKKDRRIDSSCKTIRNAKHTKLRANLENLYYIINSKLPF